MERSEIKGSMCIPVPKKLEQHGSVGFTNRPYNNVRPGYHHERAKKRRRRRHRRKVKPDEVKDMVVDARSKEESLAQPAGDKARLDDEVNKLVADAGSKEERKRPVTQEFLDYVLNTELADYMLCNPPRKFKTPNVSKILFIPQQGASMSDLLNGTRKLEADVLRQNRANKESWQVLS